MASKRAIRRRSCGAKRRYPDAAQAQRAGWAAPAAELNRRQTDPVEPYRYGFCRGWHVGHRQRLPRWDLAARKEGR